MICGLWLSALYNYLWAVSALGLGLWAVVECSCYVAMATSALGLPEAVGALDLWATMCVYKK